MESLWLQECHAPAVPLRSFDSVKTSSHPYWPIGTPPRGPFVHSLSPMVRGSALLWLPSFCVVCLAEATAARPSRYVMYLCW